MLKRLSKGADVAWLSKKKCDRNEIYKYEQHYQYFHEIYALYYINFHWKFGLLHTLVTSLWKYAIIAIILQLI